MMDILKDKKYKITALKHVNSNNTSVFAHYKSSVFTDSADRMYIFFKTSCNNITSSILCEDFSLGICIIIVYRGYKYSQDSSVTFHNFKKTVEDCLRPASVGENAVDNKNCLRPASVGNGWTMKALAELFECEHRSRDDSLPLSKFISLIQISSDGFFLDSTYAVISCLYTLCNGLSVPLVTESGFKLEKFIK